MIGEEGPSQKNLIQVNAILLNQVNASKKILATAVLNALEIPAISKSIQEKQESFMQSLELQQHFTRILNKLIDKQISIKHQFEYRSYIEEYESMILNSRYLIHDKQSDYTDGSMERGEDSLSYVLVSSKNMQKFICEGVRSKKLVEMIKNRALLLTKKTGALEDKQNTLMSRNRSRNKKQRTSFINQTIAPPKNYTRLFFNKHLQSQTTSQLYKQIESMDELFEQNYQKYCSFTKIYNLVNSQTHQLLKQLNQKSKLLKERKSGKYDGVQQFQENEMEDEDIYDI